MTWSRPDKYFLPADESDSTADDETDSLLDENNDETNDTDIRASDESGSGMDDEE